MPIFPESPIHKRRIHFYFACLVLSSCAAAVNTDVAMRRLEHSPFPWSASSGFTRADLIVVREQEVWQQIWDTFRQGRRPQRAAPVIDFAKEMLVVATLGQQRSGGHNIEIVEARIAGNALQIRIEETYPAPDCIVTANITSPVDIVILPRHPGPIEEQRDQQSRSCSLSSRNRSR
jgi:hypothetical protein